MILMFITIPSTHLYLLQAFSHRPFASFWGQALSIHGAGHDPLLSQKLQKMLDAYHLSMMSRRNLSASGLVSNRPRENAVDWFWYQTSTFQRPSGWALIVNSLILISIAHAVLSRFHAIFDPIYLFSIPQVRLTLSCPLLPSIYLSSHSDQPAGANIYFHSSV